MKQKVIVLLLIFFVVGGVFAQTNEGENQNNNNISVNVNNSNDEEGTYAEGKMKGKEMASGSVGYFVGGCLCGVFGYIFPLISDPSVPTEAIMGKSSDYTVGFSESYKKATKGKNYMMTTYGCLTGVAASTAITVASAGGM